MTTANIIEARIPVVTGLWDEDAKNLYTRYRVSLHMTGKIMGGIPQKPEIIESWLRQRITGGDEEIRMQMAKVLDELGHDVSEGMTMEQLYEAAKEVARKQNGNTFRRDAEGLFISNYQVQAMLKESVAILYPYAEKDNRMGLTSKAAKAYWAERIFVDEPRIHLGRMEPDGVHLQIGHVTGPQGQRNTLTYYDYCENQEKNPLILTFTCWSLNDPNMKADHKYNTVTPEMWKNVLMSCQMQGLGAVRSMSYGRHKVVAFEEVK